MSQAHHLCYKCYMWNNGPTIEEEAEDPVPAAPKATPIQIDASGAWGYKIAEIPT